MVLFFYFRVEEFFQICQDLSTGKLFPDITQGDDGCDVIHIDSVGQGDVVDENLGHIIKDRCGYGEDEFAAVVSVLQKVGYLFDDSILDISEGIGDQFLVMLLKFITGRPGNHDGDGIQ
jgi:hypothetical protein